MTVTSTPRGITGKQLLIGTVNDQVLALDKRYFDPRRTANPTPAEREEGIVPLTDSIRIQPQVQWLQLWSMFTRAHLSHAHQSTGLRGVVTEPANLESTSLSLPWAWTYFTPK